MRINPVWFPETSFKSILEDRVLHEHSRVYHDNDQCASVKFLPHGSPVPFYGHDAVTHCFHCQQLHEQGK